MTDIKEPRDNHDPRVTRNQDELRLSEHLISTARDRLAGRDEAGRELVDVRPRERVVLGVLLPQPRQQLAPTATASALPYEPGVPIDQLPPSEMGLTALIRPEGTTVTLRVRARFALYLQHTPTHEQQAHHSGLADVVDDDTQVDDRPGDDGAATMVDDDAPRAAEPGLGASAPAEPTIQDLSGLPPDVAAAVQAAVRGVQPVPDRRREAGAQAEQRASPPGTGVRSDFFRPVYRRHDCDVEHQMDLTVPLDARPHTVSERSSYDTAMARSIANAVPSAHGTHSGSLLVPMRGRSAMRIPHDTVLAGAEEYETYLHENAEPGWEVPLPGISFRTTLQRTPEGPIRLSVTLVNETPQPQSIRGFYPEVAVYDAGFSVSLEGARVVPSEYRVIERDYRTEPLVHAHGRFCCLDEDAFAATGELRTTTLPVHRQMVYESKPELQPSFAELSVEPVQVLERIATRMVNFAEAWDGYMATAVLSESARRACEGDRAAFADEIRRFHRGLDLIRSDLAGQANGLGEAFVRANEAFALMNTQGGLDEPGPTTAATWRTFQIVYVVTNLAALAAREAPATERLAWAQRRGLPPEQPSDLDELDVADVLWFPTGGGKSAALYGLIAVAMFYDRLRGKQSGVTAMVRFPLRMLSVQQLERVLRLVAACDRVREAHGDGDDDEPFRLGYWVGRNNTPNRITDPTDERWHDVQWMARQSDQWKRDNSVLPSCPYCGGSEVALDPDPETVRLAHRCGRCGKELPVYVTDDEIYRYLPAVLVCTVDKIASLAFNAHASHLTHGPAYRCPEHGYVTHGQGRDRRCLARDTCQRRQSEWTPVAIKDPAPALVIQDELHLLSEELGTFAAHYETLWQYLCTVGSGLPSKVLAATATISDYQNQVTQLYALTPRRFPTDGWVDGETFYAKRHDDLVRRIFVGALPSQMDVVQFAMAAGDAISGEVARLASLSGAIVASSLGLESTAPDEAGELLFQYELQCFYCNRKTHADRVHAAAERSRRDGKLPLHSVRLNGQTRLAEISDVIRRVERETTATPPADRLGSIAGTSLISHGVDLERLNVLFVMGMPSTVSYYVQATSRAGRTGVGIVFTTLARNHVRDRSVFHFFDVQHRYVNVLVEPVALNRFSTHGPRKTAGGLLAAILTQHWARDGRALSEVAMTAPANLSWADTTRSLLTRMRARSAVDPAADPVEAAQREVREAYGLRARTLDPQIARLFADAVDGQVASLIASIEGAHESLLTRSMRPRPPRSLRDVDISADFGVAGNSSRQRFEFLGASHYDDDATDYSVANEED